MLETTQLAGCNQTISKSPPPLRLLCSKPPCPDPFCPAPAPGHVAASDPISVDFETFASVLGEAVAANWQNDVRMMYLALDRTGPSL